MEKYLVSIVIPVYNGSNYVASALKCAVNQTYKNLEIIVVNDGSNDNGATKNAVEPFLSDERVKYIEKENGGVSSALNYGIDHFNGDFMVWLSHDDMFHEKSIEARVNGWEKLGCNNKIITFTKTRYIDKDGKFKYRAAAKSRNVDNVYDVLITTINGCSLLLPKEVIKGHHFREDMKFMQDYYLWASLLKEGVRFKVVNKKYSYNRIHGKQVSNNMELLIKDFNEFDKAHIEPLLDKKDYKQLKKIIYAFTRRLSVRPFYKEYIDKYKSALKNKKKWNLMNSLHVICDLSVSCMVKLLRKLK